MVSDQGPHRELWRTLCLPHCPGTTLSRHCLLSDSSSRGQHSHLNTHTCMHTLLCAHPHPEWANHHRKAKVEREWEGEGERNMMGRGSVSAYTEECLPQMSEGRVQRNTCPVTQTYVTRLLIAPPKIGRYHHLRCFACSSADQGKVNIQNIQMAVFHIWLYSIEFITNL